MYGKIRSNYLQETKHKTLIRELKDELKALKRDGNKQTKPPPPPKQQTPASPSIELTTPLPRQTAAEIIDLITDDSSPMQVRFIRPIAKPRKRSRALDENQYDLSGEMGDDPAAFHPPKLRGHVGGALRMRNEVTEVVSVKPNGSLKSRPVAILPAEAPTSHHVHAGANRSGNSAFRKHHAKAKGNNHVTLGTDGKLFVPNQKRRPHAL